MVRNRLTRSGFTLIEMMVAMALSLGIMLILTESFKMALDFVRGANSTGELISQLNGAGILLTRDLQAEHFLDPKSATGGPKLSDQRLDIPGWTPPTGGFFRIVAPTVGGYDATDPQGFNINSPATSHQLHFTSILPIGGSASSFTAKSSSGGFYASEAAEIGYFLVDSGRKTSTTGQILYNLIRREKLVAKTSSEQSSLAMQSGDNATDYQSIVSTSGPNANTLADLVTPVGPRRMNPLASMSFASGSTRYGEDIVVSNVLSFEVLADWTGTPAAGAFPANSDAPYDFLPAANSGVFETGNTTPAPAIRIKSLQVVIRIFDPRVKQTRQNTWKFAM